MALNDSYPRNSSPDPVYGIRKGFCIADFPTYFNAELKVFPDSISANTKSVQLNLGARYINVFAKFADPTMSCTINLYTTDGTTDTLVLSVPNITASNAGVYFGNYENVDLGGLPIKLEVANLVNTNSSTMNLYYSGN